LADGSEIRVNKKEHRDLFWAMKGAGHNFGIVTSAEVKIYPALHPTWHWHNYLWTQDKLETVFEELNKLQDNGSTPVLLGSTYGTISLNTTISETEVK
jgi:FAD/FMN-containing dehydrogenase